MHSNHRDGQGRVDANYGSAPHYEPNSFGQWQAQPDFAEGWNRRATMYYLSGDYLKSLADIDHVLELEPRHFGAISGLGVVNMALERIEAARDAFERVLSLYPLNMPAQENLKLIKKRLDESDI